MVWGFWGGVGWSGPVSAGLGRSWGVVGWSGPVSAGLGWSWAGLGLVVGWSAVCGPRGPDQPRTGPDRPRPDPSPFAPPRGHWPLIADLVDDRTTDDTRARLVFSNPMLRQKIFDSLHAVATSASASSSWSTAEQCIAATDAIHKVRTAARCTLASGCNVVAHQRISEPLNERSLPSAGGAGTLGKSNHIHGRPTVARMHMHLPSVCGIVGYTDVEVP